MCGFFIDAVVLMLLIKFIGGEDVNFWLAFGMGALASLTIFGVGELVIEFGLVALLALIAGTGIILSILIWILGEVEPTRAFLIGGIFIAVKIGMAVL